MKRTSNKHRNSALRRSAVSASAAVFILALTGIFYLATYFQKWISAVLTDDEFDHFLDFN